MTLLLLASLGWAGVTVTTPDGPLHPGRTAEVHVAVTDASGTPVLAVPRVDVDAGTLRPSPVEAPSGLHGFQLVPHPSAEQVHLTITTDDGTTPVALPIEPWPASPLQVPRSLDGQVGGEVVIRLRGDDLPDPELLRVHTPVGEVVERRRAGDQVELVLDTDGVVDPIAFPVAIEDPRAGGLPAWVTVRLRKRVLLLYETDEDATLTVWGEVPGTPPGVLARFWGS